MKKLKLILAALGLFIVASEMNAQPWRYRRWHRGGWGYGYRHRPRVGFGFSIGSSPYYLDSYSNYGRYGWVVRTHPRWGRAYWNRRYGWIYNRPGYGWYSPYYGRYYKRPYFGFSIGF